MMSAAIIQVLLLWAAVFIGLDLAFGEGALTQHTDDAIERTLKWLRELLRQKPTIRRLAPCRRV
jgi:hypothetical protein